MIKYNPLVTIITVCYNSEKTIRQTIESVLNQTCQDIEYLIIDGLSTDGTVEIIKEYEPRFNGRMRWISEKDNGIFDAMNKGIIMAKGELIGLINSDDWYDSDSISAVVGEYAKDKTISIFHGDIHYWNNNLSRKDHTRPSTNYSNLFRSMTINHASCFVTKSAYLSNGFFKQEYRIAADYELMLRYYKKGLKFLYLPRIIANMTEGGLSEAMMHKAFKEVRDIKIDHGINRFTANWHYAIDLLIWLTKVVLEKLKLKSIIHLYRKIVLNQRNKEQK